MSEGALTAPHLERCIHCGLCLEYCPTYTILRQEPNSPRGRLAIWRAIQDGRLEISDRTDFFTDECVGCLACENNCPSNVPYGEILSAVRSQRVAAGRKPKLVQRLSAWLVPHTKTFQLLNAPARLLRKWHLLPHRFVFPGSPAVFKSTAAYAEELMDRHRPTGPKVALFTGCLMEGLFREINFATVRVLIANNVRVIVPREQACCGAVAEHCGAPGKEALDERNRAAFDELRVDCVIANSAGCGLALKEGIRKPVVDVMSFLGGLKLKAGKKLATEHVYLDLPCHLCHGLRVRAVPPSIFQAFNQPWSLAPHAEDCCGSGGTYNLVKPDNAKAILARKAAFLEERDHAHCTVATVNHVCMMQWNSARARLGRRKVAVKHLVQLLDEAYGGEAGLAALAPAQG